ncbi:MAG: Arc family DNA binding domain-containing protein [Robiginitomaculum sp.]|nr:MAG: Arc family DNA binding domain-containing protein [Robiginitomaculum sp.]
MALKVKKNYPLRIHEDILTAMKRWSDDELRSLNGQIEFVLRGALRRAGRLHERPPETIETEEQKK